MVTGEGPSKVGVTESVPTEMLSERGPRSRFGLLRGIGDSLRERSPSSSGTPTSPSVQARVVPTSTQGNKQVNRLFRGPGHVICLLSFTPC